MDYDSPEYQDLLAARRAQRKSRSNAEVTVISEPVMEEQETAQVSSPPIQNPLTMLHPISRIKDSGGSGG